MPGNPLTCAGAGLSMVPGAGRPQPQRMISALPPTTTHAGYAPQILASILAVARGISQVWQAHAATVHAPTDPRILSAPASFRLSDGPALLSQPAVAAAHSFPAVEGPFLSQAAVDIAQSVPVPAVEGPSVVQNHSARAAGATGTLALQVPEHRRPLARNRIRAEVAEAD